MVGFQMRRRGFTLIELLVVVAIIALLISILLPSLARARESARIAVCQTRMRSWGQGFQAYASTYDGMLPFDSASANAGVDGTTTKAMGQWANSTMWFNGVGQFAAGIAYCDLQAGSGKLPMQGAGSAFVCPSSEDAAAGDPTKDSVVNGYFVTTGWISDTTGTTWTSEQRPMLLSYGMNAKIRNIDYDYHGTTPPGTRSKSMDVRKLARLEPGGLSVLLAEKRINPAELAPTEPTYAVDVVRPLTPNATDPTRFASRHRRGGNILFADGHVGWFSYTDVNKADTVSGQFPVQFNQPGIMLWNWTTVGN